MSLFDHIEETQLPTTAAAAVGGSRGRSQTLLEPVEPASLADVRRAANNVVDGISSGSSHEPLMFMLDRVQFSFPDELITVAVASNMLCVALRCSPPTGKEQTKLRLLRIDLDKPDAIEDIVFSTKQRDDTIQRIFYSPGAAHLIVTCTSGDNYYLHQRWTKPRLLTKMKGVRIYSVAWSTLEKTDSTGPLLIGSSQGQVFETELLPRDDLFKKEERYFQQVFTANQDTPIVGLHAEAFPYSRAAYWIVISTENRLYQLVGDIKSSDTSFFGNLFSKYDGNAEYQELPGSVPFPQMRVIRTKQPRDNTTVQSVGWLTGTGVFVGKVSTKNQAFGSVVIEAPVILPYPSFGIGVEASVADTLLSFTMTDFHYVLLAGNEMIVASTLNNQVVAHEFIPLTANEMPLGMTSDVVRNTHWLHTNLNLYEIIVTEEDRNVWRILLNKKLFDEATLYAKRLFWFYKIQHLKTEAQRNLVKKTQADFLFSQHQYTKSAECYAETDLSFEEICLRFIGFKTDPALTTYLRKKLDSFKKSELTQIALVSTWLIELLTSRLCAAEQRIDALNHQIDQQMEATGPTRTKELQEAVQDRAVLETELRSLLRDFKDRLHHATVYTLLGSHGRTAELIFFAELVADWEKLISFYIGRGQWQKALEVISRQLSDGDCSVQDSVQLYYKYSSILIQHIPKEVISLWMKVPSLNPRFLLPSMLNIHITDSLMRLTQANLISYLSYLVSTGNRDRVVHNYLLLLYASQSSSADESAVIAFINSQLEDPLFDIPNALRICKERDLTQSTVQLYAMIGLFDEAVDLALKRNDLELARIIAERPDEHDGSRKRLWLRIAQHVISHSANVARQAIATYSLHHISLGNLKIEEILPFFSDFVLIDDFKDELCTALEEYNAHISTLKSELDDATKASEDIRHDIRDLKNRQALKCSVLHVQYVVVPVAERCHSCERSLMTRQFFAFPCQHTFHADCLIDALIRDSVRGKKIQWLRGELEKDSKGGFASLSPAGKASIK
eukprot:jgi/Hompol1/1055/HPOL_001165-RA